MTFTQAQTFKNRRVIDPNLYLIPDLVGIFFNQILIGATKTCHTTQTRPHPWLGQSAIPPSKKLPKDALERATWMRIGTSTSAAPLRMRIHIARTGEWTWSGSLRARSCRDARNMSIYGASAMQINHADVAGQECPASRTRALRL